MLAHRSGLKHFDGDLLNRLNYSRAEILHRVRYLVPGSSFRGMYAYSNIGIFIAGEAGARADNSSWEEVLSSRILKPLGMNRSGPNMAEIFKDGNRATAHNIDNTTMPYENDDKTGAAGSVVSTGADMARWMHMLLTGDSIDGRHILKSKTLEEIFKPSMVTGSGGPLRDPAGAAGLGCDSYDFMGHRVVEKNGALDGFRAVTVLIPDKKAGITVIANKQLTAFPEAIRAEFLERLLGPSGQDLQTQTHQQQLHWNTLAGKPNLPDKPNPPCKDLGTYAGNYLSNVYGIFSVAQNGGNLTVEAGPDRYPGKLQHWSDNTFLLTFPDPDDPSGLINFAIGPTGNITGFDGVDYVFGSMLNFGHFDKV
jgi:CubicO group peptidase (beta-lactamase class C family)